LEQVVELVELRAHAERVDHDVLPAVGVRDGRGLLADPAAIDLHGLVLSTGGGRTFPARPPAAGALGPPSPAPPPAPPRPAPSPPPRLVALGRARQPQVGIRDRPVVRPVHGALARRVDDPGDVT